MPKRFEVSQITTLGKGKCRVTYAVLLVMSDGSHTSGGLLIVNFFLLHSRSPSWPQRTSASHFRMINHIRIELATALLDRNKIIADGRKVKLFGVLPSNWDKLCNRIIIVIRNYCSIYMYYRIVHHSIMKNGNQQSLGSILCV